MSNIKRFKSFCYGLVVMFMVSCGYDANDPQQGSINHQSTPGLTVAYLQAVQKSAGPEYTFAKKDLSGVVEAKNFNHQFLAELSQDRLRVSSSSVTTKDWSTTLRFSRIGRANEMEPAPVLTSRPTKIENNRATLIREGNVEEWYLNGPLGIEQGFVLPDKPKSQKNERLLLEIEVKGDLRPKLSSDGKAVQFVTDQEDAILRYDNLYVQDAKKEWLDARFEVENNFIRISIDDANAQYPLQIDPVVWVQVKKLTGDPLENVAYFGNSVAVSGNIAIVGADYENVGGTDRGAAYIFYKDQGGVDNWGQVKKLTAGTPEDSAHFGRSVAVSGNIAIVGADWESLGGEFRGAAYIFYKDQGGVDNWGQVKKLTASIPETGAYFGNSVTVSGDIAIVGAPSEDVGGSSRGAAYIFYKDQGGKNKWGLVKRLTADTPEDVAFFGISVALSGSIAIVGTSGENLGGTDRGAAYIFYKDQGGKNKWGQVKKLTGDPLENGAYFGYSLAISDNIVIVGAQSEDVGGSNRGAAYIFYKDQGGVDNWGQVKRLTAETPQNEAHFGGSVAVSGNTVIVSAMGEIWEEFIFEGVPYYWASYEGAAYIFSKDQGGVDNWGQVERLAAPFPEDSALFGDSVAVSGNIAIVGSPYESLGGSQRGAAYIFRE